MAERTQPLGAVNARQTLFGIRGACTARKKKPTILLE